MTKSKFFPIEEDPFIEGAQSIAYKMQGALLILQTKPQVEIRKIDFPYF